LLLSFRSSFEGSVVKSFSAGEPNQNVDQQNTKAPENGRCQHRVRNRQERHIKRRFEGYIEPFLAAPPSDVDIVELSEGPDSFLDKHGHQGDTGARHQSPEALTVHLVQES
jgi:hypothetical protein